SNAGSSTSPTTPSSPTPPSSATPPAVPTYTISGVITAYRNGPISSMHVDVVPYPYGGGTATETDSGGRYEVRGLTAQKVGLQISSPAGAYTTAFKYNVASRDQTINFVVQPIFRAPAAGGTVARTISGDEFIGGDDDVGGRCKRT